MKAIPVLFISFLTLCVIASAQDPDLGFAALAKSWYQAETTKSAVVAQVEAATKLTEKLEADLAAAKADQQAKSMALVELTADISKFLENITNATKTSTKTRVVKMDDTTVLVVRPGDPVAEIEAVKVE